MVIKPLIDGLSREEFFLRHNNPTWRFRAKRCEFIRPIREYVETHQEPTLLQFMRYYDNVANLLNAHDTTLNELEKSAETAHMQIIQLPGFVKLARTIEEEDPAWRAACLGEDAPKLLAEHTINWIDYNEIPNHYISAKAWEKHRQDALLFRKHNSTKSQFDHLKNVLRNLNKITPELKGSLVTIRDNLADNFGLSPVI